MDNEELWSYIYVEYILKGELGKIEEFGFTKDDIVIALCQMTTIKRVNLHPKFILARQQTWRPFKHFTQDNNSASCLIRNTTYHTATSIISHPSCKYGNITCLETVRYSQVFYC
ncbi:MAG: hypothetical protein JKX79_02780 [Labilibaculum sp.]|nr:hypothetical protein [Labilibaculum sp.]